MCLCFDEVRIKEQLVDDKHSCEIIGFVNLGDVNNELLEMECAEKGDMQTVYGEEHACVHGSWIVPKAGISLRPISLLITFR